MGLASAEEPDGVRGLGDLEGEDTDLTARGVVGHERRGETVLLGDCVELLCARVGKRALGHSVVTTSELKVDKITNIGLDDLWVEDECWSTRGVGAHDNGDVLRKGGGNGSKSGDEGGRELHGR